MDGLEAVRSKLEQTREHWQSLLDRGGALDPTMLKGQVAAVDLAIRYIDEELADY